MPGRFRRAVALLTCGLLVLGLSLLCPAPARANDSVIKAASDSRNWALPAGNYANWRYSPLKQINRDTIKDLKVAWTFSTGVLRGHQGSPLVVGDLMYVHTPFPNYIMALDLAKEGEIRWFYEPIQEPDVIPAMCCDTVNRGTAYADGMIFFQQADTTIIALKAEGGEPIYRGDDQKNGPVSAKVVWRAVNGDPKRGETNTATVLPVKDKLIAGLSGGEFGVRCHVTAYDLHTGQRVWRAYATGPDADLLVDPEKTTHLGKPVGPDSSIRSWAGDQWKIGGGCAWGWYSYDPQLNLIYYGTGNPSTWNPVQRPGDNRWTETIWARDADTGVARWVYQMTPHDEWGYDGVNEMILADLEFGGVRRPCLVHFDHNGFAYILDRATGELLSAERFDPAVNWAHRIELDKSSPDYGRPLVNPEFSPQRKGEDINTSFICPWSWGAKGQQPAAFDPGAGMFYAPLSHMCMDYEPFKVNYAVGLPYVGATLGGYPAPVVDHPATPADFKDGSVLHFSGGIVAWDPVKSKIVWTRHERFPVGSGLLATGGGLIFYGTLEGYLKAVDPEGAEVFRFKTPSGIVGNIFAYEFGGKEYIGVFSGVGGQLGAKLISGQSLFEGLSPVGVRSILSWHTRLGGSLTVFSLP